MTNVTVNEDQIAATPCRYRCGASPRMLIGGKLVEGDGGRTYANIDPATEQVIGQVADGSLEQMRTAIGHARAAFDQTDWGSDAQFPRAVLASAA